MIYPGFSLDKVSGYRRKPSVIKGLRFGLSSGDCRFNPETIPDELRITREKLSLTTICDAREEPALQRGLKGEPRMNAARRLSTPNRTRQILEDLEAVRENLRALSDDIWDSIDRQDLRR